MRNFHRKIQTLQAKVLAVILGMLGISTSCFKSEYGTPIADYKMSGFVKSAGNQQAIKNIGVSVDDLNLADTTSDEGKFELPTLIRFDLMSAFTVSFTDLDSFENGYYPPFDTTIEFQFEDFTGGDNDWYMGINEQNITIFLKEAK